MHEWMDVLSVVKQMNIITENWLKNMIFVCWRHYDFHAHSIPLGNVEMESDL